MPVLIHGDAAFPGQGIVSETLNLQALPGYSTGGTIHLIANNQLGFTTDPFESRSTRYASDPAKGFDMPIIHVNADDVEACVSAVRLAHAYRETFARDALIDLIGYRRFGHNETDEPAYTQPQMYAKIKTHPPVRKLYADRLVADGVVTQEEAERMAGEAYERVAQAHAELKESIGAPPDTGDARARPHDEPRAADDRAGGHAAVARRAPPRPPRGLQPAPQARSRCWSAAARRSPRAARSTGRTPSRSRSARCSRWACRCA